MPLDPQKTEFKCEFLGQHTILTANIARQFYWRWQDCVFLHGNWLGIRHSNLQWRAWSFGGRCN